MPQKHLPQNSLPKIPPREDSPPRRVLRAPALTAAGCLALSASLVGVPAQAAPPPAPGTLTTVADGLVGPLALAVGNHHELFVTQGFMGNLSRVGRDGSVSTVAQMPPGEPTPEGSSNEIAGVDVTGSATVHIETDYLAGFSHLVRTDSRGGRTVVSDDFLAHEAATNPDGSAEYGFVGLDEQCAAELADLESAIGGRLVSAYAGEVFSHPYNLDVARNATYVADAGGNAVLKVSAKGAISTVAVLPPVEVTAGPVLMAILNGALAEMPHLPEGTTAPDCLAGETFLGEPVPTDVEMGSDGLLYVTTLSGVVGEALPLSHVYAVDPAGGDVSTVASGLHGATGVAVAPDGTVFAAELFGGQVSVVDRATGTASTVFAADSPGDVEVKGSTLFATTGVFDPGGNGAVVKLEHWRR